SNTSRRGGAFLCRRLRWNHVLSDRARAAFGLQAASEFVRQLHVGRDPSSTVVDYERRLLKM
ncbi:MAG: hypothetical protein ACREMA_08365, partial [Longimicrobiales bacterium]